MRREYGAYGIDIVPAGEALAALAETCTLVKRLWTEEKPFDFDVTPHISASGDSNGAEPVKRLFAENLRRFLNRDPLLNLVDRSRGY